jgi:hypothetical protein
MKLSFPGGEHKDVIHGDGVVRVGSAGDCTVVLPAAKGISARHVDIEIDAKRGITLLVADATSPVHVNARPVKQKAILRFGDVITAGQVRMLVRPDQERTEKPPKASDSSRARAAPPRVVLRGVAGAFFGKVIQLRSTTVIGRGSECDLVLDEPNMSRKHAQIENTPEGLFLRDIGSANGTYVNGNQVRDTVLKPGDQIAFDQNRFLIEAPGYLLEYSEEPITGVITQVQKPIRIPEPKSPVKAPVSEQSDTVDWIIMGAAVVTLVALAVLVYLEFGRV